MKANSAPQAITPRQSLNQERAAYAIARIRKLTDSFESETCNRFRAYVNTFPAMIQTNGIGQALAFAKMKGNGNGHEARAWQALYDALGSWLTHKDRRLWSDSADVLEALVSGDQQQYQRAQAEAQQLLVWLKQFARATISGSSNDASGEPGND